MSSARMFVPMILIISTTSANAADYMTSSFPFYDLVPSVIGGKAHCAVIHPSSAPVARLEVGDHLGYFDVYGDAKLAPAAVSISMQEPPGPSMWPFQLSFYSQPSDRIESLPYAVMPENANSAILAYLPSVVHDDGNRFTFPVFARRWEFLGAREEGEPARFACLYFVPEDTR